MRNFLELLAVALLASLLAVFAISLVLIVHSEAQLRKIELKQKQAETERVRQCALAWPLKGSNYEECINE